MDVNVTVRDADPLRVLDQMLNAAEDIVARDLDVASDTTVSLTATAYGEGFYTAFATIRYPDGSYDTVSRGWNREGAPF